MTYPMLNMAMFKGEEYYLSADFDRRAEGFPRPKDWGLNIKSCSTACWEGYNFRFAIEDDKLIVRDLIIGIGSDDRTPLNGIRPTPPEEGAWHWPIYEGINSPTTYTGFLHLLQGKSPLFDEGQYGMAAISWPEGLTLEIPGCGFDMAREFIRWAKWVQVEVANGVVVLVTDRTKDLQGLFDKVEAHLAEIPDDKRYDWTNSYRSVGNALDIRAVIKIGEKQG